MSATYDGMPEVRDRLTKLETLAVERAKTSDERFTRIETTQEKHGQLLEAIRGDIRDAKTGLQLGGHLVSAMRWFWGGVVLAAGWAVGHWWPK